MKDKYNIFLKKLLAFDISFIIVSLIMLFPIMCSIPYSFVKLGVELTNIILFIYLTFMNVLLLLFIPLFIYYQIQKDKKSKSNDNNSKRSCKESI